MSPETTNQSGSNPMAATVYDVAATLAAGPGFPPNRIHEQAGADVNLVRVRPGQGPGRHVNSDGHACLYVVAGSVEFEAGPDIFQLKAGQLILVPPGLPRCFRGGPEGADLLAVHLPAVPSADGAEPAAAAR